MILESILYLIVGLIVGRVMPWLATLPARHRGRR